MKEKKLVIFGQRNFAELAHYYFEHDSPYSVRAFVVDEEYLREPTHAGLPVVTPAQLPTDFPPEQYEVFVAIGMGQVNRLRAGKLAELEAMGYSAASYVSSKAIVAHGVEIRPNTMIMEQSVVQPKACIGRNCILFPSSAIGFRTSLGEHCWIVASKVAESVRLGPFCFVGVQATIGPGLSLGEGCIVGAGAVVLNDAGDHTIFRAARSDQRPAPERMRRTFGVRRPGS
jgi:sugar O-acyltransferase (sialic acid O-acetyltransferase NeuD family)